MDYEKKYREALELARIAAFNGHQSLMEGIFPELRESEDEEIKKDIKRAISVALDYSYFDKETANNCLVWLEKQGETSDKIHYWTEEEIEPIISDYLRGAEHYGGMIGRLRCLKPKPLEKQGTSYTKRDVDDAYLKGISDAKNELEKQGDSPIKWNKNIEGNKPQINHSVLMKTTHGIAEGEWKGEYWLQYRWAGIVRDSDVLSWMELSDLDKQGEQKPAWSEEDEHRIKDTVYFLDTAKKHYASTVELDACINWLKSLKERIGG